MPKMVFDEYYGELTFAQRAAYRKNNVTPYEHTELAEHFGESEHAAITAAVKDPAHYSNGMFNVGLACGRSGFAAW